MYKRTTHAPPEGKYAYLTKEGHYAERPTLRGATGDGGDADGGGAAQPRGAASKDEAAESRGRARHRRDGRGGVGTRCQHGDGDGAAVEVSGDGERRLQAHPKSFVGQTLVLGVGKRIQDEKHKIWVATVHDPYSFRGPEDRAAGGGASEKLALSQNGAPKGWSASPVGEASVNADESCCIS